ncbi:NAD(+) diphosphatase [Pacificibacter marinus]|uniref:NAD(+) diphosphatase n=1 Tax=Pacificibacter marinus TaxID=658057 RepID=UPI001C06999F|nr:NAD(+) diphosphatase [Pacificibacter marinus]MBU2868131.1 NAD(+) diphosphatase [Pacificibacter marinus]
MMMTDTVTFSAGLLHRRDDLRKTADVLQTSPEARFLPLWTFKPLIDDAGGLMMVPQGHPLLKFAGVTVFLGLDDSGAPLFAVDVSTAEMKDGAVTPEGLFDTSEQRHDSLPRASFRDLKTLMTDLSPLEAEIASTARAILGWHKSHKFCAACGKQSDVAVGGWQRSCGACGTSHFPRTDPVVIMLITHGNSVLLGRSPHFTPGMYSLLAGFVEPGEPIEAAVRREVMEEAGIPVGDVSYMASQPWPFPASLMIGCRGTALSRDITIDENELEDALWLTKEECAEVMAGTHPDILPAREGAIAHFLLTKWLADE